MNDRMRGTHFKVGTMDIIDALFTADSFIMGTLITHHSELYNKDIVDLRKEYGSNAVKAPVLLKDVR